MTGLQSPKDAMPWVGLYASVASLLCTLAMAADAFLAFRQWRLYFPCKLFTINAVSITLIAIAMKLPVDLTTDMPGKNDVGAKNVSVFFLHTMLGNFLPSLGLMGDKEIVTNIIAFGILLVTIIANVLIQSFSGGVYSPVILVVLIFPVMLLFSVALIVPTFRRILERQYKELDALDLARQEVNYSYKELTHNVKKSWMMAETGNPQFLIACSSVSYIFGVLCLYSSLVSFFGFQYLLKKHAVGNSDYKWSTFVILTVQMLGIVLGSIGPIFRCFTFIGHFNISRRWSLKQLNVFKVEKYWIERLQHWKHIHVRSHILGRHLKIVFNSFKNIILNICIALQITLVVICKTIALVPRFSLIILSCCGYLMSSFERSEEEQNASNNDVRSDMDEYTRYILFLDEETQLSKRLLRNTHNSITKLIHKWEKKEPSNLVKLLKISTGFNGVLEFDNNQVPPLHLEENQNSWSLVAVTLTAIAIAVCNTTNNHVKELIASMKEGLTFVTHVEEALSASTDDLVKARKASNYVWTEVEVYNKWLDIDLQRNARRGKTSKETLRWLGDEAVQVVIKFKSSKNGSLNNSVHKFLAASSMYRISETILRHYDEQQNWPRDQEIFRWISTMNADVLCACFTNLPRVIRMKCHDNAIGKREDGIRDAAQLLGRSKTILKILESRQLPNIDPESMAYIDKWRALPESHIRGAGASAVGIHQGSSSSNETYTITIM